MNSVVESGLRKMFRGQERQVSEDQMPREVAVPLPPQEFLPPRHREDESEIMAQAAALHQRTSRTIEDLRRQLAAAEAMLIAKDNSIGELKLILAQERNNAAGEMAKHEEQVRSYRAERDQAIQDRSDLVALFGNIFAMLERFELPVPIKRRRRTGSSPDAGGNGDHGDAGNGGTSVPDQVGSQEGVS